jgi:hypothetical protein
MIIKKKENPKKIQKRKKSKKKKKKKKNIKLNKYQANKINKHTCLHDVLFVQHLATWILVWDHMAFTFQN